MLATIVSFILPSFFPSVLLFTYSLTSIYWYTKDICVAKLKWNYVFKLITALYIYEYVYRILLYINGSEFSHMHNTFLFGCLVGLTHWYLIHIIICRVYTVYECVYKYKALSRYSSWFAFRDMVKMVMLKVNTNPDIKKKIVCRERKAQREGEGEGESIGGKLEMENPLKQIKCVINLNTLTNINQITRGKRSCSVCLFLLHLLFFNVEQSRARRRKNSFTFFPNFGWYFLHFSFLLFAH